MGEKLEKSIIYQHVYDAIHILQTKPQDLRKWYNEVRFDSDKIRPATCHT